MIMVSITFPELALKWSFFFSIGSTMAFEEYSPLFLRQLGFTALQVGFTTGAGIPALFVSVFGFLGDRFRARKRVLVVLLIAVTSLLSAPALVLAFPLECDATSNSSASNTDTKDSASSTAHVTKHSTETAFLNLVGDRLQTQLTIASNSSLSPPSTSRRSFDNRTTKAVAQRIAPTGVDWSTKLFVFIVLTRGLYECLKRAVITSYNVATMTHLQNERTNYGSYYCWGHIGASFTVFAAGIMAFLIKLPICGIIGYGYFAVCLFSASLMGLCLCAVPWIKYEYLEHRVINWSDVRGVVFSFHYLVVLFVGFSFGCCFAYQTFWENWYIAELSGGPLVMALCGITRRPFLALWFHLSGRFISKVGELRAMAAALLLASVSLLALSFIQISWLVLLVDVFMSAALAVSYSALNVHLSKAGSEASSSVILALADGTTAFGMGAGSTLMGVLFSLLGSKTTLLTYAIAMGVIFVMFTAYILVSERQFDGYEKIATGEKERTVEYGEMLP